MRTRIDVVLLFCCFVVLALEVAVRPSVLPVLCLFFVLACDPSTQPTVDSAHSTSPMGFYGSAGTGGTPVTNVQNSGYPEGESSAGEYTLLPGDDSSETQQGDAEKADAQEDEPGKKISTYNLGSLISFVKPVGVVFSDLVTLQVTTASHVARVEYLAEPLSGNGLLSLGTSEEFNNGFSITTIFFESGNRTVGARAYDAAGAILGTAWKGIYIGGDAGSQGGIVTPDVSFISPTGGSSTNPVTFIAATQGEVSRVRYVADGLTGGQSWTLGESTAAGNGYYFTYSFNQGGPRTIRAQALDAFGSVVSEDLLFLDVQLIQSEAEISGICAPGQTEDCVGNCANATWIGDGVCDDGSEYDAIFTCPQHFNDGGDCDAPAEIPQSSLATQCANGYVVDCVGNCAKSEWIGDGFCDDGSEYNIVLTCPTYNNDEGDCTSGGNNGNSGCSTAGQIKDCNGACQNGSWVGDGICDDGSQHAAVFKCAQFNQDEGDCGSGNSGSGGATPVASNGSLPYFYQYSNLNYPGSTCQNTSVAMVLAKYGWGGVPDDIFNLHGKNKAQSPSGLASVFNSMASSAGIPQRLQAVTNGTIQGLKALLAQGKPVIVHGFFTGFGHVLVVTGYSNGSYTVHDPAGKWNQQFKGGYPFGSNSTIGKGIQYSTSAFELAISSTNGSNFEPLWYHKVIND